MAIEFQTHSPRLAPCAYHEVKQATVIYTEADETTVHVEVYSWASRETRAAGAQPVWGWRLPCAEFPDCRLALADVANIATALISHAGSPFYGGQLATGDLTLEAAKTQKWIAVKREYEQRNQAPLFVHTIGTFDCDEYSQGKIKDMVAAANNLHDEGRPIAIDFTLFDNTEYRISSLSEARHVGFTMMGREIELRARRNELRLEIDAAETIEQVQALSWEPAPEQLPPAEPQTTP